MFIRVLLSFCAPSKPMVKNLKLRGGSEHKYSHELLISRRLEAKAAFRPLYRCLQ